MVERLDERNIDEMLYLQRECLNNCDLFLPTSREGYLRAFAFDNFCVGYREEPGCGLIAFLNCSVPSERAAINLGRGRLPQNALNAVGHMNTLLVLKSHRGEGIGRDLVRAALEIFRGRGCAHIYVTADAANAASIRLLHAMEFSYADTITLQGCNRYLFYRKLSA